MRRPGPAALLALAYVGGAVVMAGTYFDTAWHRTLSRDSFWSAPHLGIYGGGMLVWVAATSAIVLATRGQLRDLGGPVGRLGPLRWPFGFTLAAAGVMVTILAAPVDIWWHAAFGKDVVIWSPPHMQAIVGGMIADAGLLFAAAAQRDRGVFASPVRWKLAVLLPAVHFIHLSHYGLAHYTMTPPSRTPDLYPFLVALLVPAVLVALARAAGAAAPLWATIVFFAATVVVDVALRAIGFERYTLTPVLAVPALAVTLVYACAWRAAGRPTTAIAAGIGFVLVFVVMETAWMALVVRQPWPAPAVMQALPFTLAAGALSAIVGWTWGGFLRAPAVPGGAVEVFGGRGRARLAGGMAVVLIVVAIIAVYRPQVYGPPMTVAELALEPTERFPVQEAVFWEAVLDDDWRREPRLEVYSEGVIDGIPLPIGPAWCARDVAELERELAHVRFAMTVNDVAVDLGRFPVVRQRLRDGRVCGWVGVVSRAQRASRNRVVYTITPGADAPPTVPAIRVNATVVFKDP